MSSSSTRQLAHVERLVGNHLQPGEFSLAVAPMATTSINISRYQKPTLSPALRKPCEQSTSAELQKLKDKVFCSTIRSEQAEGHLHRGTNQVLYLSLAGVPWMLPYTKLGVEGGTTLTCIAKTLLNQRHFCRQEESTFGSFFCSKPSIAVKGRG